MANTFNAFRNINIFHEYPAFFAGTRDTQNGLLGQINEFGIKMRNAALTIVRTKKAGKDVSETEEAWRLAVTVTLLYGELKIDAEAETVDFDDDKFFNKSGNMFLKIAQKYIPKEYGNSITIISAREKSGLSRPIAFTSPYIVFPAKEFIVPVTYAFDCPFPCNSGHIDVLKTFEKGVVFYLATNDFLVFALKSALQAFLQSGAYPNADVFINRFISDLVHIDVKSYDGRKKIAGVPLINTYSYHPFIPFDESMVFNEKICLLDMDDKGSNIRMFLNCEGNYDVVSYKADGGFTALLPLTKHFVETFLVGDSGAPALPSALKGINMREIQNGEIVVYINFDLNGSLFYFTHTYFRKDFLINPNKVEGEYAALPGIAIWPDKIDPNGIWRDYYLFQTENNDASNLCKDLQFTLSDKCTVKNQSDIINGQDGKKFQTINTEEFPYFLYAELYGVYCGLVIAKPKGMLSNSRRKNILIGMDFGTTSSAGFMSEIEDSEEEWLVPEKLDFSDNSVLEVVSPLILRDTRRYAFVEQKPKNNNSADSGYTFYTVLHIFGRNLRDALIDSNILFVDINAMTYPNFGEVPSNIKWNDNRQEYADLFVEQFVKMCAWKALEKRGDKLTFRMSFPSALTNANVFEGKVKRAVEKLNIPKTAIDTATESRAAALYFQNIKMHYETNSDYELTDVTKGIMLVDIGGGSVDYSLIQNQSGGRLNFKFYESSLAFAGKAILTSAFTELRKSIPDFQKLLYNIGMSNDAVNRAKVFIGSGSISKYTPFELYCEACLASLDKDSLFASLSENAEDTTVFSLIKIITFNLCAIAYYAGKIAYEAENFKSVNSNTYFYFDSSISFVACGNGSRLLDWVHKNERELIEMAFLCGAEKSSSVLNVDFIQSRNPKEEVAGGLVSVKNLERTREHTEIPFFNRDVVTSTGVREAYEINNFIVFFLDFIKFLQREKEGRLIIEILDEKLSNNDYITEIVLKEMRKCRSKTTFSKAYALILERLNKGFRKKLTEKENV